jgi:Carboxypeptidase regulatory-like domain/TonB dependent receptor
VNTKLMLYLALFALMSLPAFGQTFGAINGAVTDASGSIVVGATVTVTNPQTNFTRSTISNESGNYNFPDLPPGTYNIKAEKQGFQTAVRSAMELQVQQTAEIDFKLPVGAVSETVEVSGGAPLLDTENAAEGTVIETKRIEDLPLNGRSFVSLVSLSPNVVSGQTSTGGITAGRNGGDRGSMSLAVSGTRRYFTYFTLDGVPNTDVDFNTYALLPSIDALQEFKVQTGVYSAEFGHEVVQVNISSKSGTNQYHGTVYEFLRNNDLDARPFAFTSRVPASAPFKWNQFGFTLGGPIVIPKVFNGRNRLFFFSNYEGFRLRDQAQAVYSVPSAAMRTGNFSQLSTVITDPLNNNAPFADNIIPANRLNPISVGLLQYYPAPNVPGAGLVSNYLALDNNLENKDQFNQRVDFIESEKSNWFGRYSFENDAEDSQALVDNGSNITTKVQQAMLSNTRILSPTIVNEFRFGYSGYSNQNVAQLAYQQDPIRELNIPIFDPPPYGWGVPNVSIEGFSTFGDSVFTPFITHDHTFQWTDGLSWTHGAHSFKFGIELRRDQFNETGNQTTTGNFSIQNQATGYGFSDFLLGYVARVQAVAGLPSAQFRATSQAYYATDSWKARHNLTIEAGLRYEYTPPWSSRGDNIMNPIVPVFTLTPNAQVEHPYLARNCAAYGQDSFYPPESQIRFASNINTECLNGQGTTLVKNDLTNFAPRLGIAWNPTPNLTIRMGAGIFYAQDIGDTFFDMARNNAGRLLSDANFATHNLTFQSPFTPSGPNPCGNIPSSYSCISDPLVYGVDPNMRTPYVEQYTMDIQRQLTSSMVLEVGYLGSQGHHLERAILDDTAVPSPTGAILSRVPFPEFNTIQMTVGTVNSNYESGHVKLTQRLAKGLTALIGYTFSKSLDDASGISPENSVLATKPQTGWCVPCEYGLSDFNSTNRFVASVLYELPFGKGKPFLNQGFASHILGGWQLNSIVTASSGFPLTISDGTNQSNTNVANDRPNAVPGVPENLSNPTTAQWFNLASVQLEPFGTFGNVGRNTVIGPGILDWDFSALKNFYVTEQRYLQFRFECFNCANHPNFGDPGTDLTSNQTNAAGFPIPGTGNFGEITSTRTGIDMRELQFSLKFIF